MRIYPHSKNEQKAQNTVRDFLFKHHRCITKKVHGNMYNAGAADVLVHRPDGVIVPFKWTDREKITKFQVIGMLRESQLGENLQIYKMSLGNTKIRIVICSTIGFSLLTLMPDDSRVIWDPIESLCQKIMQI
jgi:hypothetical protein